MEVAKELAVTQALAAAEKENIKLKSEIEKAELDKQLSEKALRDKYELEIQTKDEAIERYKDFKQRLSTKMLGETLEEHCSIAFNSICSTAFPNAYFEKDNDSKSGSRYRNPVVWGNSGGCPNNQKHSTSPNPY